VDVLKTEVKHQPIGLSDSDSRLHKARSIKEERSEPLEQPSKEIPPSSEHQPLGARAESIARAFEGLCVADFRTAPVSAAPGLGLYLLNKGLLEEEERGKG
jgi:hypothetical protein